MLIKATCLHPGPPQSVMLDMVVAEVVVDGMVVDLAEAGVIVEGNVLAITELIT